MGEVLPSQVVLLGGFPGGKEVRVTVREGNSTCPVAPRVYPGQRRCFVLFLLPAQAVWCRVDSHSSQPFPTALSWAAQVSTSEAGVWVCPGTEAQPVGSSWSSGPSPSPTPSQRWLRPHSQTPSRCRGFRSA